MHPTDTHEQQVQESRYALPVHWTVERTTRRGRQKYGRLAVLFELVSDLKGKKVLDFGCGDGWITKEFVARGAETQGVDYSERAISFARILVPGATFTVIDGERLPFPDATFDYIFMLEVLEHIPSAEISRVLNELNRTLKPSGALVLSVPSVLLRRGGGNFSAHFQHFTSQSLQATLAPQFSVSELRGQDRRAWWVQFASTLFENRWFFIRPVARWFNGRFYFRYLNHAPLSHAGHLFAVCRPSPRSH